MGCDLEMIEPRSDAFVADYFTVEEQALVARASAADRSRLLALLWSAKESALKALRAGLRLDTRCVIVIPCAGHSTLMAGANSEVRYTGGVVPKGKSSTAGGNMQTISCEPWSPLRRRIRRFP